jgi:DNA replication initiation complex subunit (GINS family)
MLRSGLKAVWRNRQASSEVKLDDEFYRERARLIRELDDKADPFIRKRFLDLAGNYDSMVRRSPRTTATVRPNLPNVPDRE